MPFDAAVIRPFAFTVMFALVKEPTFEFTLSRVAVIAVVPEPSTSPEIVIVWLPVR